MTFIGTSMYIEASSFIKKMNLKKDLECHKFQVFKNDNVVLIITGVGKVISAVAVTYLFLKYKIKCDDIFINIGICGSKNKNIHIGDIFLCNKITDYDTKKTFYPDIILKHPFKEGSIETISKVINNKNVKIQSEIVDMEASAIYEAALMFLQPHEIFFIKIVSDHLNNEKTDINSISSLVESKSEEIVKWINDIKNVFLYRQSILDKEEQRIAEDITRKLRLTATMANQLKQLLKYYKLEKGKFDENIRIYTNVQCTSKKERVDYFEQLKRKII